MKGKDLGKNGWKAKVVVFMKTLAPKYSPMPINPRNHTTQTWARGLARSLFFLTWDTAQLYKGKDYPRVRIVVGGDNSITGCLRGYPSGRHYGSPGLAVESRSK